MKIPFIILLTASVFLSCGNGTKDTNDNNKTTTFYLVRHAEKDVTESNNPQLTEQGEQRAQKLAVYLKNIDAVYATPYKRTQATASYTAKANNITVQSYQPNKLFNKSFLKQHNGQRILIVGHSNTIPQLVNKMTKERTRKDIPDDIYNRVYKVVFKNGKATATMETIN